jgi:hypothetical protein
VNPRKEEKTTVTKELGHAQKEKRHVFWNSELNSVSYQTHAPPGDKFIVSGFDKIHNFWEEGTPPPSHTAHTLTLTSLAMSSLSSWPE